MTVLRSAAALLATAAIVCATVWAVYWDADHRRLCVLVAAALVP